MTFKEITITRVIIHKIIGKTVKDPAYSEASTDIHKLDPDTTTTLLDRIYSAVNKSKRFFETQLDNTEKNSFWDYAKNISSLTKENFILSTTQIADLAVEAHQSRNRPGGLLLIIDAKVDRLNAVIVIKAELQQAFIINDNAVELIKELFLSPAKEFFKIGILIHRDKKNVGKRSFDTYIYDDNFTPQKNDLTSYFYSDFLGFSTHENDKLKTNNFMKDFITFVDANVNDNESRRLIKIKIKADYRESSSGIIDPSSYSEYFVNLGLDKLYQTRILSKFPRSFSKDISLVEGILTKSTLSITNQLKLSGPSDLVDHVEIVNTDDLPKVQALITKIESRDIAKVIVIKTEAINPNFYEGRN